jgi:hypothetical protein
LPPVIITNHYLAELLGLVLANQEKIIMAQTALDAAVAAIQTTLAQLQTDMAKAFSDLEAAVAGGNPADVASAVTALGVVNTSLQGLDTSAVAADGTTQPAPPAPPSS